LVKAIPYKINIVLTDNGIQFADFPKNRSAPTAIWRGHPFDRACQRHGIEHRLGLQGAVRGKPMTTTHSDKAVPCLRDHVNRQFQVAAPNMLWVSDFTYVATWQGFVYVAAFGGSATDCFADGSPRGDRH